MAFDLSAFFGGFAEGAAVQVTKKNKEILESTNAEMERLYRSAERNKETAKSKRDELKAVASELTTYKGLNDQGFTDQQIIGLLQSGTAKNVLAQLKKKEDVGTVDFSAIVKVATEPTDKKVEDVIGEMTTLPKGEPLPADTDRTTRTAFGLRTNVAAEAEDRFSRISGMSTQDLRAAAGGLKDTPITKDVSLDLSQFKDPEGVATVSARLAENLSKGIKLDDPINSQLVKKLQAFQLIKGATEDTDRTAAAINSVFEKAVKNEFSQKMAGPQAYIMTMQDGTVAPIKGKAGSENFYKEKSAVIKRVAMSMGILDENNRIIKGGQSSKDALLPYGSIEGNNFTFYMGVDKKSEGGGADNKGAQADAAAIDNTPPATPAKPTASISTPPAKVGDAVFAERYALDPLTNKPDLTRPVYRNPDGSFSVGTLGKK